MHKRGRAHQQVAAQDSNKRSSMKHVDECRALLRGARTPEERQMLLNMADTWDGLAVAREKKLAKERKTEEK